MAVDGVAGAQTEAAGSGIRTPTAIPWLHVALDLPDRLFVVLSVIRRLLA
jgi:hypothetical protein